MHKSLKMLLGLSLSSFMLNTYAIQVNVQTTSKEVSALGFTVNGKSHGGIGNSYSKKDMPAGSYSFGVRVGGLTGNDVGCSTDKGKTTVALNNDSTAVLNYNGQTCSMRIYSGVRN